MSDQAATGGPSEREDVYQEDDASTASAGEGRAGQATTATAEPSAARDEPLFSEQELSQFDADDGHAGSVIGKMLALFFLYTVIVMSVVAWWTFRTVD